MPRSIKHAAVFIQARVRGEPLDFSENLRGRVHATVRIGL